MQSSVTNRRRIMQNFIIVITYKDGNVKNIYTYCTIEQASKAVEAYKTVPSIESVDLRYK